MDACPGARTPTSGLTRTVHCRSCSTDGTCRPRDSNPESPAYHAGAFPFGQDDAMRREGIEPPTSCTSDSRSSTELPAHGEWMGWDSNPHRQTLQACALPLELPIHRVDEVGLEPTSSRVSDGCSNQLSFSSGTTGDESPGCPPRDSNPDTPLYKSGALPLAPGGLTRCESSDRDSNPGFPR